MDNWANMLETFQKRGDDMPLNLRDIAGGEELNLQNFLGGMKGRSQNRIANTLASVQAGPSLVDVAGSLGGDRGAAQEQGMMASGRLGRALQSQLAGQGRNEGRSAIQAQYDNLTRMATQHGANLDEANAYARQNVQQLIGQQQRAASQRRKLALAGQKQDISEGYAQRGLQNELAANQPSNDYEAAMTRALFGLAGTGIAAYGLREKPANQPYGGQMPGQALPSLRANTGYSSGLDLYGRRY